MESTLKEKLLMLAESDFSADDIKLYLDTHPDDAGMIMKLCLQAQKSMMLRNEIETRFGYPITATTASIYGAPFRWINAPWPWCPDWPKGNDDNCEKEKNACSLDDCIKDSETEDCK